MWRNFADLFRTAVRRQNVLKPDARINSEECKQVCGSECNIFNVDKSKQHIHHDHEKGKKYEREERLKDCRSNWESSLVGALGWSGALVLGWYLTQPLCWRRFLQRRRCGNRHLDVERFKCLSLLDVVSRYALSQPLASPRHTSLPVAVVSGEGEQAIPYGPITAEQAVDEAAEKFAEAQNQIMGAVENNKGVQLMKAGEHKKAVLFFKRASAFENARAAYNLGICHEKGMGTSRNLEEAARWYELASSRGHAGAMYNLGVFYARGLGDLKKDRRRARQLFESAAELGQPEAALALEKIKRFSRAERSASDTKALYSALGLEAPHQLKESGDANLRSLRVSEAVVHALGLGGQRSEMLHLAFDGQKLSGGDSPLKVGVSRGCSFFRGRSGVRQPMSFCKSEVSDIVPDTVYANFIRA